MKNITFPRQRLYDVNHYAFIKSTLTGTINKYEKTDNGFLIEKDLERVFYDYTGIKGLIPLSRGRLAIYFAVKHSISSKRRKVILSPFTIFDLVNMVLVAGGYPFFIDSEPGTAHISYQEIARAIDEETAAVIVTHYHSTNRDIGKISALCRSCGVALIEDCAISLGARVHGQHVGSFGDFALFSFGLFKFVSTYYGGGMIVRDKKKAAMISSQLESWPRMSSRDLFPYFIKGVKFSVLTQKQIFNYFTFPIFRFGYLNNINFIKNNAKNDPNPILRNTLPSRFKRRPSIFQIREFVRQIPMIETGRRIRIENALRYYRRFESAKIDGLPEVPDRDMDCYLNFPLIISKNKEKFVAEMMKSDFDLAVYYYRNCAEIECFNVYYRDLPNIASFVKNLVFFPVYPGIDHEYIDKITKRAIDIL